MTDSKRMKAAIQSVIQEMMDNILEKVLEKDPFLPEKHRAAKPLYAALVPDEIFKGSHFERRFVTPFGKAWEKLAQIAAIEGSGHCLMGHVIRGNIQEERLKRITEVLNKLEHPKSKQTRVKPNWNQELSYILEGKGENIPATIVCDIYVENQTNNEKYAFELKAPLPNSDQTKVSKEKILKLYCMQPKLVDAAFFALPYNPYGSKDNYSWSFPKRWFNMTEDEVVLIGNEFWEKIGGQGTYQSFIDAVNEIGQEYKARIYRDFLGIEPPNDGLNFNLETDK